MRKELGTSWFPRVGLEGLGRLKMKHEKGLVPHGPQEWGGKGLGRFKMKHQKGFGCFSWFPRVGWEGLGKAKN